MPAAAVQLVQAALLVVGVLALAFAFRVRPRANARELALARAQWLTVATAAVGLALLTVTVLGARARNPFAVLSFLGLAAYVGCAALVVGPAWRRHRRLVQAEEHARWTESSATPTAPRHRGLSGEDTPPTRW